MPRTMWILLAGMLALGIAMTIASSPKSYLYAVFTGQCFSQNRPLTCFTHVR
jgi:hypothetical protein